MALDRQIPPIRVEQRTLDALARLARRKNLTLSTLIRQLLEEGLTRAAG